MQWYVKKLGHPKITIHNLQTYNEQENNFKNYNELKKKLENHSTTQNTFIF